MRYESKFERKKASNINNKNKKKRKNSLNLPFCFHRSHHHQDDGNLFFREEKNSMIIIDDKKAVVTITNTEHGSMFLLLLWLLVLDWMLMTQLLLIMSKIEKVYEWNDNHDDDKQRENRVWNKPKKKKWRHYQYKNTFFLPLGSKIVIFDDWLSWLIFSG